MREIIFDTETTGLSPDEGHRMVELGCVEVEHRMPTGRVLHLYFNPERDMPMEAFEVHGLSSQFLSTKPLFADHADEIAEFFGNAPLVAHNAQFDIGFLNAELQRVNKPLLDPTRAIDTAAMARKKFPGSPVSLDALCRRFQIDLAARDKHGALLDSELLAKVYLELCGGREPGLGLSAEEETASMLGDAKRQVRPSRPNPFVPNEEDQSRHQAMLDELQQILKSQPNPHLAPGPENQPGN
jgi:DNA polymerase III, epsilon subunit, Proteobacterial